MEEETRTAVEADTLTTATASMCFHCFDVLIEEMQQKNRTGVLPYSSSSSKTTPLFNSIPPIDCPLFVTWEKQNSATLHYELRGCIGTLGPQRLPNALGEYASLSAFRDRRFRPISPSEVPQLRVAVSLLVHYETCDSWKDWIIGTHGIVLKFFDPPCDNVVDVRTELSATYLPEVALQQRWDHHQTVSSLVRKAGYKGIIDDEFLRNTRCTRYQSSMMRVTFAEYVQYCQKNGRRLDSVQEFGSDSSATLCKIM
jgi:AMME syndrome candidate gene 1 protein